MQNADIADIADISFLSNVVIHVVKCSEPDPLLLGAVGAWAQVPSFWTGKVQKFTQVHRYVHRSQNFTQFHMFKIPFPSTSFYVPAEPRTKPSMHHQHLHAERTQFPEMQNRYLTPIRILIHIFELVQTQKPTETWLATESHLCSHEEANNVANVGDEEHEELQIGCTQWIDLNQDAKRYESSPFGVHFHSS